MIIQKHENLSGSSRRRVGYPLGLNHDHKCEHATFLGGNVYTVDAPDKSLNDLIDELTVEMDSPCHLRAALTGKDSGKCHTHYSISLAPNESFSIVEWKAVSEELMRALGYGENHKWFAVLHEDTAIQHIHLCGNRIDMETGLLLNEGNDYIKGMECMRRLEEKYGLTVVPMPQNTWGVQLKRREVGTAGRANEMSPELNWKHTLIARIATAAETTVQASGDMVEFVKALKKAKVNVEFTTKDGDIIGISYEFRDKSISGRELKRSRCTFRALITREKIPYENTLIPQLSKVAKFRNGMDQAVVRGKASIEDITNPPCTTVADKGDRLRAEQGLDEYLAIQIKTSRLYRPIIAARLRPTRVTDDGMLFAVKAPEAEDKFWEAYGRIISYVLRGGAMISSEVMRPIPAEHTAFKGFLATIEDGPIYRISDETVAIYGRRRCQDEKISPAMPSLNPTT